ncbi:BTB domain-containing protein [Caenorhabditis elegans]|uniref:BTB domain-containing protein n=1 Tax=Caenorhabditis elegans TaxID=6239 RepID=Q9BKZ7_CAEEL|nr:BTB domain-containing protein [Caenorhabditis elegans]CCD73829.1 BTB domain-containing protein [Caenorhabditis elegans]|eukprot:NP_497580.1 Uncharacterized protein CELE_Y54F10AM.11 [Caenorhabditis elegans]
MAGMDFSMPKELVFDAIVVVEERKFHVGKQYLATHSRVFQSLFATPGDPEITIQDVSSEDFLKFLEFMYHNTDQITAQNVESLLTVSARFGVDFVMARCENWLSLDESMDFSLRLQLAETYKFWNLFDKLLETLQSEADCQQVMKMRFPPKLASHSMMALCRRAAALAKEAAKPEGAGAQITEEELDRTMKMLAPAEDDHSQMELTVPDDNASGSSGTLGDSEDTGAELVEPELSRILQRTFVVPRRSRKLSVPEPEEYEEDGFSETLELFQEEARSCHDDTITLE